MLLVFLLAGLCGRSPRGAWIEMPYLVCHRQTQLVAPLAGAWIEICGAVKWGKSAAVAPLAERGLKFFRFRLMQVCSVAPSRSRGLNSII